MSERDGDNTRRSRRGLLKALIISGGAIPTAKILPAQWSRPVVNAVMLPVHAQTTMEDMDGEPNGGGEEMAVRGP
jgi:hypothetical protein